jgi:hypothetical protein
MDIFKYENWPYFFIGILILLIIYNFAKCRESGGYLTQLGQSHGERIIIPAKPIVDIAANTAASISKQGVIASEQNAAQIAKEISGQNAAQIAREISEKAIIQNGQNAAQIAADVAAHTTNTILTEAFSNKIVPPQHKEKFTTIQSTRTTEGADVGAQPQNCSCGDNCECHNCSENLNDQINYGVNNYIFPGCNNDFMCANGCNIQDQINNYSFDYYTGHTCTELDRSHSGAYTSLAVDSCSQNCPSMGWMPPAIKTREEAAQYIASLNDLKKN